MNKQSTNISCDVCLDLIPLVHDQVASKDSNTLVYEHIAKCASCKTEFINTNITTSEYMINDDKIIRSLKKSLFVTGLIFITFGALLGVYLSNSMGMFYNFLIMPIVGGLGYLTFKNKWIWTPVGVLILSYIWLFIQNISDGILSSGFRVEIFWNPLYFSGIYSGLTIIGVVIAALLKYAFRKEGIE